MDDSVFSFDSIVNSVPWDEVPTDSGESGGVFTFDNIINSVPNWPGADATPVPTSDPWGTVAGVFNNAAKFVSTGVNAYSGFVNQRNLTQLQVAQTRAAQDVALSRIAGQNQIDQARIAAQTATTKQAFARMPALTALFGGATPPTGNDFLMLALTAAGVFFAWRSVKHG